MKELIPALAATIAGIFAIASPFIPGSSRTQATKEPG
jgi:hypothetical protein